MQMPTELLLELRDTFNTFFNEDSLNEFALALGVDYENLPGSGKSAKARELALHLWRHSLLTRLAEVGPKRRPDIDWVSLLRRHGFSTGPGGGSDSSGSERKLAYTDLQRVANILAPVLAELTPQGRNGFFTISGIKEYINVDLNGPPLDIASTVLAQLNEYGPISETDFAVARLLRYLKERQGLPGSQKTMIEEIIQTYQL